MATTELDTLIKISRDFGNKPDAVQGGGGNTSVKTGNGMMYVKASGVLLRAVDEESFLLVDKNKTIEILMDKSIASLSSQKRDELVAARMTSLVQDDTAKRPSIETFLHALLGKYVVHIHPVYANALTCLENGSQLATNLFKDKINFSWVGYDSPGYPLGLLVKKSIDNFVVLNATTPDVVFLQNHGIIISSDNVKNLYVLYSKLNDELKKYFGDIECFASQSQKESLLADQIEILASAFNCIKLKMAFKIFDSPIIKSVPQSDNLEDIIRSGALYPDQVVYCGETPLFINPESGCEEITSSLKQYIDIYGYPPKVIYFKELGIVLAGTNSCELDAAEEVLEAHIKVLLLIKKEGKPSFLSDIQSSYIAHWESEKYRRKLMVNQTDNLDRYLS